MIHSLKELIQRDMSLTVLSYINEQLSELLGYTLTQNKIQELSCTTHFFVNIDDKLNILGIIITSCKTFLFDENIFFIELLVSKNQNNLVEQSLLLKSINHIGNISNDSKIISFITDERIQKEVLTPFGFVFSQGIMVKI